MTRMIIIDLDINLKILLLVFNFLLLTCSSHGELLEGSVPQCHNEGEEVHIELISDNPCITCICKNREVICHRETCAPLEGCYMQLFDKKESCCDTCKGCTFKGKDYVSETEWVDEENPCIVFTCKAGIITISRQTCLTSCKDPVSIEGQCCPSCKGCIYEGVKYSEGKSFKSKADRCATCVCHNGTITCSKIGCPVLACPRSRYKLRPDSCCPECRGERKVFDVSPKCLLGTKIHNDNHSFQFDKCTHCICQKSTTICSREICPILECPVHEQLQTDSCCPMCPKKKPTECKSINQTYKEGETWKLDLCSVCTCKSGEIKCSVEQCPNSLICPQGHKLQLISGQCCHQCIENDAVCTVFGDPHYKTFDGKVYNFQGTCKYLLTEDCRDKTFSVFVHNDPRQTKSFSWTKNVYIEVGEVKVYLQQNLVVKVDKEAVKLPYIKSGVLTVIMDGNSIHVITNLGVRILWDGDSYLEVSVPSSFKDKLCGLCGNYNKRQDDEFITKEGFYETNAVEFGNSWRIGSSKTCTRLGPVGDQPTCHSSWDVKIRAVRTCNLLKSPIFAPCTNIVNPREYYKSCLMDMCECQLKKRCYCESQLAYVRACSQEGIIISEEWRKLGHCGEIQCPKGAVFDVCGPACPKTCSNWNLPDICMKPCIAGCQCPAGKVFHNDQCIFHEKCPR